MASSRKFFIDSSVLYAFVDRADINHSQAVKIIEQLSLQGCLLFTSLPSIQETYNAIANQLGETLALDFLQAMTESSIEIIYPQKADLMASYKLLRANRDKQISLKETLVATLMQKKSVMQVLTFTYWHNLLGTQSYGITRF